MNEDKGLRKGFQCQSLSVTGKVGVVSSHIQGSLLDLAVWLCAQQGSTSTIVSEEADLACNA